MLTSCFIHFSLKLLLLSNFYNYQCLRTCFRVSRTVLIMRIVVIIPGTFVIRNFYSTTSQKTNQMCYLLELIWCYQEQVFLQWAEQCKQNYRSRQWWAHAHAWSQANRFLSIVDSIIFRVSGKSVELWQAVANAAHGDATSKQSHTSGRRCSYGYPLASEWCT